MGTEAAHIDADVHQMWKGTGTTLWVHVLEISEALMVAWSVSDWDFEHHSMYWEA